VTTTGNRIVRTAHARGWATCDRGSRSNKAEEVEIEKQCQSVHLFDRKLIEPISVRRDAMKRWPTKKMIKMIRRTFCCMVD
jgi:hypothetical protein